MSIPLPPPSDWTIELTALLALVLSMACRTTGAGRA
jgi:hypothetical protein